MILIGTNQESLERIKFSPIRLRVEKRDLKQDNLKLDLYRQGWMFTGISDSAHDNEILKSSRFSTTFLFL